MPLVLGIAIECRRLDVVRRSIVESKQQSEMLEYCFNLARNVIQNREFRHEVLRILIELYSQLAEPDYINMCQSLLFLNDHKKVAGLLNTLIQKGGNSALLAYQIGFDLGENQNQPFLNRVASELPTINKPATSPQPTAEVTSNTNSNSNTTSPPPTTTSSMDTVDEKSTDLEDTYESRMLKLRKILNGEASTEFYLQFLYNNNHTDLNILKQLKDKLEARNSVTHNATVMAHSFMHVGTTVR